MQDTCVKWTSRTKDEHNSTNFGLFADVIIIHVPDSEALSHTFKQTKRRSMFLLPIVIGLKKPATFHFQKYFL